MEKLNKTNNIVVSDSTTVDVDSVNSTVDSVNSKEDVVMTTNNNTVENTNTTETTVDTMKTLILTEEPNDEVKKILELQGIQWTVKSNKKEPVNHLKKNENGEYECQFCHEIVNLDSLDEETKDKSKKSGLCPKCLSIMKQAEEIKKTNKSLNVVNRAAKNTGVGGQIRQMIAAAFNNENMNDTVINDLMDKEFSRIQFKLAYPTIKEITGMSTDEIKSIRMYNGHSRYSPQVFTFNNREFILTNDLYNKNLEGIQQYLTNQNLI